MLGYLRQHRQRPEQLRRLRDNVRALMVCATGVCDPCGGGFFKPQVTYATGAGVDALALGDLYGRGKLDVVVGYGNADMVQTLLGAGDGTFGAPTSYPTGTGGYPSGIALGDFNNDGKLDVAAATAFAAILMNTGAGLGPSTDFAPAPTLRSSSPRTSIATASSTSR